MPELCVLVNFLIGFKLNWNVFQEQRKAGIGEMTK